MLPSFGLPVVKTRGIKLFGSRFGVGHFFGLWFFFFKKILNNGRGSQNNKASSGEGEETSIWQDTFLYKIETWK